MTNKNTTRQQKISNANKIFIPFTLDEIREIEDEAAEYARDKNLQHSVMTRSPVINVRSNVVRFGR